MDQASVVLVDVAVGVAYRNPVSVVIGICFEGAAVGFQRFARLFLQAIITPKNFPAVGACMFGELCVAEQVFEAVFCRLRICIETHPECGVEGSGTAEEEDDVCEMGSVGNLDCNMPCGPECERECGQCEDIPVAKSTDFGIGKEGEEEREEGCSTEEEGLWIASFSFIKTKEDEAGSGCGQELLVENVEHVRE